MKKEDFKPAIIKYFEDNSGLSLEVAKKQITNKMKANRDGSEYIKAGNVRLFYTNNPNYAGGLKNGFGAGFYITNGGFTGGSTIKL